MPGNTSSFEVGNLNGKIEALNDQMGNIIKSTTFSGTTSSAGNLETSLSSSDYIIIAAFTTNNNQRVIPWNRISDNKWFLSFITEYSGSPAFAGGVSVSGEIYYIDK